MREYDILPDGDQEKVRDAMALRDHLRDYTASHVSTMVPGLIDSIVVLYGRLALQIDIVMRDHSDG